MKQDLKLSEKLFCMAVNPASGGLFMGASATLGIALSGLVLMELMHKGLISMDNGMVNLVNPSYQHDEIHEFFMSQIRLKNKDQKIRTWIFRFNRRGRKIQKMYISHLVRRQVLRLEEKRFLFIPYNKVFLMDRILAESIRNSVKNTLMGKNEPTEEAVTLALMAAKINMLRHIIPDKTERKIAVRNLKILPETPVLKAVKEAVQMMYTTVVASSS